MTFHISKAGRLRDRCSPALLPQSLTFCNSKIIIVQVKGLLYMCIDCDGHHYGGSSLYMKNDFCYYRNCLYIHRYRYSSEKEQVNESPSI